MFKVFRKKKDLVHIPIARKQEDCCSGGSKLRCCWLKKDFKRAEKEYFTMDYSEVNEHEIVHQRQKCCTAYVYLYGKGKLPRKHMNKFGSDIQAYRQYLIENFEELQQPNLVIE